MSYGAIREYRSGKVQRNSNLELFRILSMLAIVAHHYVVNSGLTAADGPIFSDVMSSASLFLLWFGAWGKTGINCFVLITGYFMCKSNITAKKFAKLLLEIYFYNIVINTVFWVTGYAAFSVKELIKILIPVQNIGTGFTSAYLVFFLFIPFLNILLRHLTERQHVWLLVLCSFMYVFLGTIPWFSVTMNYVSWFIVLYFMGSYIRLYPKPLFENTKIWAWAAFVSLAVSSLSVVACSWIGLRLGKNLSFYFMADSNKFLAVAAGLSSFLFFKNVPIRQNRFINAVASTTFGVLMIHANSDTMRQWLWKDMLRNVDMYASSWMPVHAVCSVLGVFIICSALDYLRICFIENPFFRCWDKHWDGVLLRCKKAENSLFEKLHIQN